MKRVYSSLTGGTVGYTRFVYHGSQVAYETDSAGTVGLRYTWGPGADALVAVDDGSTHDYAVTDRLGSVRALARADGTWLLTQRFTPYGETLARDSSGANAVATQLRYRWTGREYDAETGFYFFRARSYSPSLRRFVQADPLGYAAGMNLYAYVDGSVLEATDPSGLEKDWQHYGAMADPLIALGCFNGGPCFATGAPGAADAAFEQLIEWGASTYAAAVERADYRTYVAEFRRQQGAALAAPDDPAVTRCTASGRCLTYTNAQVWAGATPMESQRFGELEAAFADPRLPPVGQEFATWIDARLFGGEIGMNDRLVRRVNADAGEDTFGYTFGRGGVGVTMLGNAANRDIAWAVGHETLHLWGDFADRSGPGLEYAINWQLSQILKRGPLEPSFFPGR